MAAAGARSRKLNRRLNRWSRAEQVYFLVNTLDYLHKGGRIGGASRLVGSLLQIKPILTIIDGQAEAFDKVRTYKQALQRVEDLTFSHCVNNPEAHLTISHCDNQAEAQALAERLQERLGRPHPHLYCAAAIVVHAGPAC